MNDVMIGEQSQMDDSRIALVTGGASGIGRATARRLSRDGFVVAVGDIDDAAAKLVAEEIRGEGGRALAIRCDVSSLESCRTAISQLDREFGRLDALVCSAGIGQTATKSWEQDEETWTRIIDVNLSGTWRSCSAALPLMLKNGAGRIVMLSSVAGKEGNPFLDAYSASKAGILGYAKTLGKELATSGILVNAVTPALIDTPILDNATEEVREQLAAKIPMGRLGRPEEVAALLAWLVSEDCSFTTAAVFDLSGGRSTY